MKKVKKIFLNLSILFLFVILLLILIFVIKDLAKYSEQYPSWKSSYENLIAHPETSDEYTKNLQLQYVNLFHDSIVRYSIYTVLGFLAIAACVFLFVYCNPRLFRISTWTNLSEEWTKNKAERAARKQAKSETDKQKRIEELQKELDELQNDKTNSNP